MIKLILAALEAYILHARWRQRIFVYELEDKIDELATDGSPVAKLRIERLGRRLRTERERLARPSDGDAS